MDRNVFQERLANSNPRWSEFVDELERTGQKLRTNPDGDVRTSDPLFSSARGLEPISNLNFEQVAIEGATYEDFVVPDCPECLKEGNTFTNMVNKRSVGYTYLNVRLITCLAQTTIDILRGIYLSRG